MHQIDYFFQKIGKIGTFLIGLSQKLKQLER